MASSMLVAMLLMGLGGGLVFMPLSMLILEGVPARIASKVWVLASFLTHCVSI